MIASDGGSNYNHGVDNSNSPVTPKSIGNLSALIMKPSISANNNYQGIEPEIVNNTKTSALNDNNTISLLK